MERRPERGLAGNPGILSLRFCGKYRGIAGDVFDLLHGNDGDFFGGIDFEHFHIVANGVANRIVDQQFLIVGKDDFDPIDHDGSSVRETQEGKGTIAAV